MNFKRANYLSISLMGILFLILIIAATTSQSLFDYINHYLLVICNFFILVIIFLTNINLKYINTIEFLCLALIIILSLFSIFFNDTNFGALFLITNLSLLLFSSMYIKISDIMIKNISRISLILLIYWMLFHSRNIFLNPNTVGIISMYLYVIGSFYFNYIRKKMYRIILILLFTSISIYIILQCESRAALLGVLTFFLLRYLIPRRLLIKRRFYNFVILFTFIGSLCFIFIYLYMWKKGTNIVIPIINKNFYTGREYIWSEVLDAFKKKFIFGLGTAYKLESSNNMNVHSSVLYILTIYGFLVFLMFTILFLKILLSLYKKSIKDNIFITVFSGIICLLIHSYFENTIIMPLTNFVLLFLLASVNIKNTKSEIC